MTKVVTKNSLNIVFDEPSLLKINNYGTALFWHRAVFLVYFDFNKSGKSRLFFVLLMIRAKKLIFIKAQLDFADFFGNFAVGKRFNSGARSRFCRNRIVPVLVFQHIQRLIKLFNLIDNRLSLPVDKFQSALDGGIALFHPVDEQLYFFKRHSGFFKAFDEVQPLDVLFAEHAYTAACALDRRQKPLFVVISQRGSGYSRHFCHFAYRVKHIHSPFAKKFSEIIVFYLT